MINNDSAKQKSKTVFVRVQFIIETKFTFKHLHCITLISPPPRPTLACILYSIVKSTRVRAGQSY